jgi:hypothetical protein
MLVLALACWYGTLHVMLHVEYRFFSERVVGQGQRRRRGAMVVATYHMFGRDLTRAAAESTLNLVLN